MIVSAWYSYKFITGYFTFIDRFPWCEGKVWAAILVDYSYPIVDLYPWLMINKVGWQTRRDDA